MKRWLVLFIILSSSAIAQNLPRDWPELSDPDYGQRLRNVTANLLQGIQVTCSCKVMNGIRVSRFYHGANGITFIDPKDIPADKMVAVQAYINSFNAQDPKNWSAPQ